MKTKRNKDGKKKKEEPIPVTILSGFLGSGKTTLLQHILHSKEHKLKVAVIVNDMAELNVDASTILSAQNNDQEQQAGSSSSPKNNNTKKKKQPQQNKKQDVVVGMENGCICCTLRDDLIHEIQRIQEMKSFDYILIESTGVAEPQQVAESFCADPDTAKLATDPSKQLSNLARLDTCVTVIDAHNFDRHLSSLKRFKDEFDDGLEGLEKEEEGEKSIADLIVDQVEFANVILLNKIDLVSEKQQEATKALLKSLNPKARILSCTHGEVEPEQILNTRLFDMKQAEESPHWLESLKTTTNDDNKKKSEVEEYGVSSFVYRARKPFHPYRLYSVLNEILLFAEQWNKLSGGAMHQQDSETRNRRTTRMQELYGHILRSKGSCWIAGRDTLIGSWSHAGRIVAIEGMHPWYTTLPQEEWPIEEDDEEAEMKIRETFQGDYGDRRQEIVFIGTSLKQDDITKTLDSCLLTDSEMMQHNTYSDGLYYDCLPPWILDYDAPGVATAVLRPGQWHRFQVSAGLQLNLSNLALNIVEDEDDEADDDEKKEKEKETQDSIDFGRLTVKVWLDIFNGQRTTLLATLKADRCDQCPLSVTIPGDEEDGSCTLRIQVPSSGRKRGRGDADKNGGDASSPNASPNGEDRGMPPPISKVEVRVIGSIMPMLLPDDHPAAAASSSSGGGECQEGDECYEEHHK